MPGAGPTSPPSGGTTTGRLLGRLGRAGLRSGRLTRFLLIGAAVAVVGAGTAIAVVATPSGGSNATATSPAPGGGTPAGGGGATPAGGGITPGRGGTSGALGPSPVTISSGPYAAPACSTSSHRASCAFSLGSAGGKLGFPVHLGAFATCP